MKCAPELGRIITHFKKPERHVDTVFLHCSASSRTDVDAQMVHSWHTGRGWSCIGYHYLIKTDGLVQAGRTLERTPAAQAGYNKGSIAICLNGLKEHDFSDAQFRSLRRLVEEIDKAYGGIRVRGHREVAAKTCPVFDYQAVLGLDRNGRLGKADAPRGAIGEVDITARLPILAKGVDHPQVSTLRALLMGNGALTDHWRPDVVRMKRDDTRLGRETDRAIRAFQEDNGLTIDGIVGRETWGALLDVGT